MRFTLIFILLCLLVTGCYRRDTRLHEEVVGTWKHGDTGKMTLNSDGSFHTIFSYTKIGSTSSNDTIEWAQDGTWDVKDGFFVFTFTNSTARNAPVAVPVGYVSRCKITSVDDHNLIYQGPNGKDVFVNTR